MPPITITITVQDLSGNSTSTTVNANITSGFFNEDFATLTNGTVISNTNNAFTDVAGTFTVGSDIISKYARIVLTSGSARLGTPTFAAQTKLLVKQRFMLETMPSTTFRFSGLRSGTVTSGAAGITADGRLSIYDGNNIMGTSPPGMTTNVDYMLEHYVDTITDRQTARVKRISDNVVVAEISGAYTGSTVDNYRAGPFTAATVTYRIRSVAIVDGSEWVPTAPLSRVRVGASANRPSRSNVRTSMQLLEQDLRAATGDTRQHLLGRHTYNGSDFPATFAQTSASTDIADGYNFSVINVKCDWQQLANGQFNQHIRNFIASIPAGHTVYLIINHEPENDNRLANAALWCRGQVVAAKTVAEVNDPRCFYAICHMAVTWYGSNGTQTAWADPIVADPEFTQTVKNRTILAPDGYCRMTNTAGTSFTTLDSRFGVILNWMQANNWPLFAISENSLNNDIGAPQSKCAEWLVNVQREFLNRVRPVYYMYYDAHGPASGGETPDEITAESTGKTAYLDTLAEQVAFGQTCLMFNYQGN